MNYTYIYIITNGEAYKVGISKDPSKRIKNLQTGSARDLTIVEVYKVPEELVFKLEKQCHARVQSYYPKRGEWFLTDNLWHLRVLVEEILDRYIAS
jgi:hypothetical protein